MQSPLVHALLVVAVAVGLAACGDDAGTQPAGTAGGTRGKTLSPSELAEAMRRGGADPAAARAAAERIAKELGGALPTEADLEQARELAGPLQRLATRPLTNADLETYLALWPKVRGAAKERDLASHGLTPLEWSVLWARVQAATTMLQKGTVPKDERAAADLALVRPYLTRLQAVSGGR